jgi:hypothetical protein
MLDSENGRKLLYGAYSLDGGFENQKITFNFFGV